MGKNKISIGYYIEGFDDITHEDITQLTGVNADRVYIKGEPKGPRIPMLATQNRWLLISECNDPVHFAGHMANLESKINSNIDAFCELGKRYNCGFSCGVYIYTDSEESTPWVHLTREHSKLITKLNAEFDLDIILCADS